MSLHLLSGINGKTNCSSMSDARYATWKRKLFINKLAPSLKSLPPTDEAFEPNVLRGHYQVCCWKYAHKSRPPSLRPLDHGWIYDEALRQIVPRLVLDGVKMVPDELVQCMSCTCKSVTACKTKKCGCTKDGLACSTFCACEGGQICYNDRNRCIDNGYDSIEDDDDEEEEFHESCI